MFLFKSCFVNSSLFRGFKSPEECVIHDTGGQMSRRSFRSLYPQIQNSLSFLHEVGFFQKLEKMYQHMDK